MRRSAAGRCHHRTEKDGDRAGTTAGIVAAFVGRDDVGIAVAIDVAGCDVLRSAADGVVDRGLEGTVAVADQNGHGISGRDEMAISG